MHPETRRLGSQQRRSISPLPVSGSFRFGRLVGCFSASWKCLQNFSRSEIRLLRASGSRPVLVENPEVMVSERSWSGQAVLSGPGFWGTAGAPTL